MEHISFTEGRQLVAREVKYGERPERIEFPGKLFTGAIIACHGVGILNIKKRIGYLGHFFYDTNSAEALVEQAFKESDSPEDLRVVLVGDTPFSLEEVEMMELGDYETYLKSHEDFRKWLLGIFALRGITNIENYLVNEPSDDSYTMEVDTASGKITVAKEH